MREATGRSMNRIITIGREFGSGGREVGKRLSEALGIAYYDREIVEEIAKRTQLAEEYVHQIVEHQPKLQYPITIGHTLHAGGSDYVSCQDERSQTQNKEKAFAMLRSKLYDLYQQQKEAEYSQNRKSQVGTGDRSERIRTYNFPQGRVTDHRIGLSLYNIDAFMDGDLDEMIEALTLADQQAKLAEQGE